MKGIVHFLSGIAVATFFPDAVNAAAAQSSFVLVLGGIAGLLPDTLDFRLSRFLERPDVVIDPSPANPDPEAIASRVAEAIDRAASTKQRVVIQLRTMRLGPDLWRQYFLRFEAENRTVVVKLGPVVNTSQMTVPEGESDAETRGHGDAATQTEARASVNAPMCPQYENETQIDIFSGPSFALEWRKGRVEIDFIPWHRRWSHSFTLAATLGVFAGVLFGPTAGAITACGYAVHILEDQLGYLGSNLFFPFTRRRVPGLKLLHSGDAVPNFFAVWTMLAIILFNLDRFSPAPRIDPLTFFALVWLPAFALLIVDLVKPRTVRPTPAPSPSATQRDLSQEAQEVVEA